ncbi:MAG: hypothetical protein AAF892_12810 [Cyanobacteria bacterium P01_D01_bin.71]
MLRLSVKTMIHPDNRPQEPPPNLSHPINNHQRVGWRGWNFLGGVLFGGCLSTLLWSIRIEEQRQIAILQSEIHFQTTSLQASLLINSLMTSTEVRETEIERLEELNEARSEILDKINQLKNSGQSNTIYTIALIVGTSLGAGLAYRRN